MAKKSTTTSRKTQAVGAKLLAKAKRSQPKPKASKFQESETKHAKKGERLSNGGRKRLGTDAGMLPDALRQGTPTGFPSNREITEEMWQQCLVNIAHSANITASCIEAGFTRTAYYTRYRADPEFAAAADLAYKEGVEWCEDEVRRRAFKGYQRGVWYQGELVGTEIEYSDTLATFVLQGEKAQKYRRSQDVNLNVSGGLDLRGLTDEDLDALIERKLKELQALKEAG